MKKNCGECDALNSIGLMVDGKMFFGDIETLQKLVNKTIAMAKLEAVEKWMAMTYDCIGNNGVIATEHFNYLAALRKAAGRGNDEGLRDYSYGWTCYHSGNHSYWN